MPLSERITTIETRALPTLSVQADAALSDYAALTGQVERTLLARHNRKISTPKKQAMAEFGLNGRQFNAIYRRVQGKISSYASNLANDIKDDERRLADIQNRIDTLQRRCDKAENPQLERLIRQRVNAQRRAEAITSRLAQRQRAQASGHTPVCFGSRKLFNAQHHLAENGYESHDDWLEDWQQARHCHIYVTGAKSEPSGCRNAQLKPEGVCPDTGLQRFNLHLALPPALHQRHGKTAVLEGLTFKRPSAEAKLASVLGQQHNRTVQKRIFQALRRAGKQPTDTRHEPVTEDNYLAETGTALSFQLVRDKRGWRIVTSFSHRVAEVVTRTDKSQGVVSLDINANHLSVTELGKDGSRITAFDVPLPRNGKPGLPLSSRPYQTHLQEAVKLIVQHAARVGKPLAIERLNLSAKKVLLRHGSKTYARMLSSFAFQLITQTLAARAHRDGVAVLHVNPAWTSLIGRLCFAPQLGDSTHSGAAMAVGQRALGLERPIKQQIPTSCLITICPGVKAGFNPPADGLRSYRALSESLNQWCHEQRTAHRRSMADWRLGLVASVRRQCLADIPM